MQESKNVQTTLIKINILKRNPIRIPFLSIYLSDSDFSSGNSIMNLLPDPSVELTLIFP